MKKSLLILACLLSFGAFAQITYSPFWTNQNSNFSFPSAGTRYMDVVDTGVVWLIGYDGTTGNVNRNCVEFSMTNNGGITYTNGTYDVDTNSFHPGSIEGISATTAWITSYLNSTQDRGAIHQTTNGGATWTNMTPAYMYSVAGTSFADFTTFLTPSVGVTLGDPAPGVDFEIYRTNDAGATWTVVPGASIPNANSGEYGLVDVYTKYGTQDIWFGTNKGRVYHSSDQGQTWSVGATTASAGITKIAFRSPLVGIAYGYIGTTFNAYKTTNGGTTWTLISPLDPNMGHNDVCNIPGTTLFASGGAGTGNTVISYSTDDGLTWNSWGGTNVQYLEIEFASNIVGYAGGFSDPVSANLNGMFRYSSFPLGLVGTSAPVATSIEMYPNPSNGNIIINLPAAKEGAVINVMDAMGKVVYSENVKTTGFEKHSLNLEHLSKGIYSVNITKAGETINQKIIIQ